MAPEAIVPYDSSSGSSDSSPKLRLGTKSDVWSLGCILYQIVYGRPPFAFIKDIMPRMFAITNPNHQISYPGDTSVGGESVSTDFDAVATMKLCLVRDPKQRSRTSDLLVQPYLSVQHVQRPTAAPNSSADGEVTVKCGTQSYSLDSVIEAAINSLKASNSVGSSGTLQTPRGSKGNRRVDGSSIDAADFRAGILKQLAGHSTANRNSVEVACSGGAGEDPTATATASITKYNNSNLISAQDDHDDDSVVVLQHNPKKRGLQKQISIPAAPEPTTSAPAAASSSARKAKRIAIEGIENRAVQLQPSTRRDKAPSSAVKPSNTFRREPLKALPLNMKQEISVAHNSLESMETSGRAQRWMKAKPEPNDMRSAIQKRMMDMRFVPLFSCLSLFLCLLIVLMSAENSSITTLLRPRPMNIRVPMLFCKFTFNAVRTVV
jgi:hypothetical protein